MKKLFVIAIIISSLCTHGQITIMGTPEDTVEKTEQVFVYDSLTNFSHRKHNKQYTFHHLIGQTIMSCENYYMGAYYRIDSILPDNPGRGLYDRLCLTNLNTGETRILEGLHVDNKYNRDFVVVGHYEKMKAVYIGKKFVYVGEKGMYLYESKRDKLIDVSTNQVVTDVKQGSIWTCIDVQVKPMNESSSECSYRDYYTDRRSPIVLVFENPQYGKCYCYYQGYKGAPVEVQVAEQPLACGLFRDKDGMQNRKKEMIAKYGQTYGPVIAQNKVQVGMTKEMCRAAWGDPYEIHTSTSSHRVIEQWIYGDSTYLYFENGKLTSIHD